MEAFSDGVITIMVLELKVPHGAGVEALAPLMRGGTVRGAARTAARGRAPALR
jgi:hypothetical protein